MSKSIEKYSSKAVAIPAHAKEIEITTNFLERAINTGQIALLNLPTWMPLVSDANGSLTGSLIGFAGSMLMALTIPQLVGTEPVTNNLRQNLKSRLARVPLLHLFANETFAFNKNGKDMIVKMTFGKSVVYDITQPNPKDLWDKMYESEIGNSVYEDFALLKIRA